MGPTNRPWHYPISHNSGSQAYVSNRWSISYTLCLKNDLTLKRTYSSKLYGSILTIFCRNIKILEYRPGLLFGFGTRCRLMSLCPIPSRHSSLDWQASRRLRRKHRETFILFYLYTPCSTFLSACLWNLDLSVASSSGRARNLFGGYKWLSWKATFAPDNK